MKINRLRLLNQPLLLLQMATIIVISFLYASGKDFVASVFMSILFVFLMFRYANYSHFIKTGFTKLLSCFLIAQTISFSNYFYQDIDFKRIMPSGCSNYIELYLFSIVWFFSFFFIYIYALKNRCNTKVYVYFALLYFSIGLVHNVWTYHLMNNIHNLGLNQYNSPYFLFLSLPVIILYTNNNLKLKYILLSIALIGSIFAFKRSCTIVVCFIILTSLMLDLKRKNIIIFIFSIIVLFFTFKVILPTSFNDKIERTIERMENLSVDGGSGRTDNIEKVYSDFIKGTLENRIFGNGFMGFLAHNNRNIDVEWYSILYYYGYVGLFLYILFHFYMIKRIIHAYRNKDNPLMSSYIVCYIIFLMYSFSGEMFTYQYYSSVLFTYLGLAESQFISKGYVC